MKTVTTDMRHHINALIKTGEGKRTPRLSRRGGMQSRWSVHRWMHLTWFFFNGVFLFENFRKDTMTSSPSYQPASSSPSLRWEPRRSAKRQYCRKVRYTVPVTGMNDVVDKRSIHSFHILLYIFSKWKSVKLTASWCRRDFCVEMSRGKLI